MSLSACSHYVSAHRYQIFLPDLFEKSKASELSSALDQAVIGSLSFNGQRCTALKLFFIPDAHADGFALRQQECVCHAAANQQHIAQRRHAPQHREFGGDFCAAENADQGALDVIHHALQHLQLRLHQPTRAGGDARLRKCGD